MRRVIILERVEGPALAFRFALWAAVPAAKQPYYHKSRLYMTFAGASAYRGSEWDEATAPEHQAIMDGQVAERVDQISVAPGTTPAQIRTMLETEWARYQTDINNRDLWGYYGTSWDGTTWA